MARTACHCRQGRHRQPQPHHSDLRRIFTRSGNLGENGSVAWQFDTLGYVSAPREGRDDDKIFEVAIEAGAENYEADAETIEFYTLPADLHMVSKNLQAAGLKPESVELIMRPRIQFRSTRKMP